MTGQHSPEPVLREQTDADRLASFVEVWRHACADVVALVRGLPEDDGDKHTDLPGWTVRDTVAHIAHLEAMQAGGRDEATEPVEIGNPSHVKNTIGQFAEQGVIARRGRTLTELCEEIERSVAQRYADVQADPPQDSSAPAPGLFGAIGWDLGTLLNNRPFDVWMHEQDIRRAVGRPGGYDTPAATLSMDRIAEALPMVIGKRVRPSPGTTIRIEIPEGSRVWDFVVGEDGRTRPDVGAIDPDVTITMGEEDFVVLGAGRQAPADRAIAISGDETIGTEILRQFAITP